MARRALTVVRVSAIDALQRGLRNLRANPMLLALQVGQGVVLLVLGLAGLWPLALAIGLDEAAELWLAGQQGWDPGRVADFEGLFENALDQWQLLVAALGAAAAVWAVAFLVYCWVQAGVMGRLAAGEAAAGAGASAADFRVYSWPAFTRDAAARIWRFFWLLNVIVIVGGIFLIVMTLGLSLMMALAGGDGGLPLTCALGCLMFVVTLVVFFFLFAWTGVAKAELVVGDGGVLATCGRSFSLMWRRLGAVLFLLILFVVASVALGLIFLPLSIALDVVIGDSLMGQLSGDLALMLIQTPLNAALTVALSASLVALVRGER